jgi:hypothetical protein
VYTALSAAPIFVSLVVPLEEQAVPTLPLRAVHPLEKIESAAEF